MTHSCPVEHCARPRHDGWTICAHHSWILERGLGDIPALAEELDVTLSRQSAGGRRNGPRASDKPLPFDYRASETLDALRSTLVGWVRDLDPEATAWPADTLPAMACWLLARMGRLRTHPAAEEAVDEISAIVGACWAAVDRAAERVYAGRCGANGAEGGSECPEPLYARPGRASVACRACGAVHLVEDRRGQILTELSDRLLTAAEIARLGTYYGELGDRERTRKLLNKWAQRGTITAHGVSLRGEPTYPFGETVATLLAAEAGRTA